MSDDCREFINKILVVNPQKRPSAKELLKTEFLVYAEEYKYGDTIDPSKTMKKQNSKESG